MSLTWRIKIGTLLDETRPKAAASTVLPLRNWTRPVREWLKDLEPDDRRIIGEDIKEY
jgi:hypothetical protein